MRTSFFFLLSLFSIQSLFSSGEEIDFESMFNERLKSVVIIEFFVETEVDRRPVSVNGIVVDDDGLVQIQEGAVPSWIPVDQLKEFQAHRPGSQKGHDAEYLGQDRTYGWHYVRVTDEALKKDLVSVMTYPLAESKIGTSIWGIGIAAKSMDYTPYFMRSEIATIQPMPDPVGFATFDVSSPGSVVFDLDGAFAGWGATPLNFDRVLTIEGRRFNGQITKLDETSTFYISGDLMSAFAQLPESVDEIDWVWTGLLGLGPLDDEVSSLMGMEEGSAITVSEIFEGGAADKAGVEERDIIVSLNGESFRRYVPRYVVVTALERVIKALEVGDSVVLGVLRGGENLELELVLEEHPTLVRQARKQYFETVGLTVREFLVMDRVSLNLRENEAELEGVIVNFVKPNSFSQTAGVLNGHLILEIDGEPISNYEQAIEQLSQLSEDESRKDFVVLVRRGSETSVLRISLK